MVVRSFRTKKKFHGTLLLPHAIEPAARRLFSLEIVPLAGASPARLTLTWTVATWDWFRNRLKIRQLHLRGILSIVSPL